MKHLLALIALPALCATAAAQSTYRPLETIDEARQRQSSQNYETYERRGHSAPLGGYQERLGDPPQRGVERPGYNSYEPINRFDRGGSDSRRRSGW